jgi:peptidoglycan hydrolase-like protein with peptidoglycan-binding domain
MMLQTGDTGRHVVELQECLRSKGFYAGALDGQFGPITDAAVREAQRSHALEPDGIVGPKTKEALGIIGEFDVIKVPAIRHSGGYDSLRLRAASALPVDLDR